jgi:hypothetical protein
MGRLRLPIRAVMDGTLEGADADQSVKIPRMRNGRDRMLNVMVT